MGVTEMNCVTCKMNVQHLFYKYMYFKFPLIKKQTQKGNSSQSQITKTFATHFGVVTHQLRNAAIDQTTFDSRLVFKIKMEEALFDPHLRHVTNSALYS